MEIYEKIIFLIIGKANKFYDEYVKNLTDKSKVFHYLINLDSGLGEYGEESVYTFDMTNLKMIKAHLEELPPKRNNILHF